MRLYNNLGFASDVLSQSARSYLIDYFEDNKYYREGNYNLIKTWQTHLDYSDDIQVDIVSLIQSDAEIVMRMKLLPCKNANLVEYVEGSYANGHVDQNTQSSLSVITMVDLSDDLKGGEAYFSKDVESTYYKMIPGPIENGDSLMYGGSMFHGVDMVLSGRRLVLVTWFKEDYSDREIDEKTN